MRSVAAVICETERVMPRTSGNQTSAEMTMTARPPTTQGVALKNNPPALKVLEESTIAAGSGMGSWEGGRC
jgi:hypothetical protein